MSSILDKISKVLAQAENATTDAEAEAYMARAQQMATNHSIELAVARRHVAKSQQRETPQTKTIDIGAYKAMGNVKRINLFQAIAGCNDLRINIAFNNTYVTLFGFPSDIEVAETLYAHIAPQMVAASAAYLATGTYRKEEVYNPRTKKTAAPSAKAARLAFYDAFVTKVSARLWEAKFEAEEAAENARLAAIADDLADLDADLSGAESSGAPESVSTAIVLADKKAEVKDYYDQTSNHTGTWKPRKPRVSKSPSATKAGRRAGSKARLTAIPTLPEGRKALAS